MFYMANFGQETIPLEINKFPAGEMNTLNLPKTIQKLVMKWTSDEDLIQLMLITKHCEVRELIITYMPYARMDRSITKQSNCDLKYIGEFIQSLAIDSIIVIDPHSELTLAYLGTKAKSVYPFGTLPNEYDVILFPDGGAQKRYGTMKLFSELPQAVGMKERDFTTGKIKDLKIFSPVDLHHKNILIVDDICSYGGTFKACCEAITNIYGEANKVDLMVSHCENSILKGDLLKEYINKVYTTDSLWTDNHFKVNVITHLTSGKWPNHVY